MLCAVLEKTLIQLRWCRWLVARELARLGARFGCVLGVEGSGAK